MVLMTADVCLSLPAISNNFPLNFKMKLLKPSYLSVDLESSSKIVQNLAVSCSSLKIPSMYSSG
jgi:hypothetical protein